MLFWNRNVQHYIFVENSYITDIKLKADALQAGADGNGQAAIL